MQLFICSVKKWLIWKYEKILRSTSLVKLFVHKTVKYEVINVKLLSWDLPLNNSAIMVKRKCLKLLYLSIQEYVDWQSIKKIDKFEIFNSWNTLYLLLVINNNNLSFFVFYNLSFLCLFLQLSKRKYLFLNILSIDLILFQVKEKGKGWEGRGGGRYSIFLGRRENLIWRDLTFYAWQLVTP